RRVRGAAPASHRGGNGRGCLRHHRSGRRREHVAERPERGGDVVRPRWPALGGAHRRPSRGPVAADAGRRVVTPLEGARAWVEAWKDGWARHDPAVIAARYAADCRFRSEPFRSLERGRGAPLAYATRSFEEESRAEFTFGEPIVGADGRAAV